MIKNYLIKNKIQLVILYPTIFFIVSFLFTNIAGAAFIRDDAGGGDCNSIGVWNQNAKTCVLTADLNDFIAIESDGITLDGASHQLIGNGEDFGIFIGNRKNVTVKNLKIQNFAHGIFIINSGNNFIIGNDIANNLGMGIIISNSHGNLITENTISNNQISGLEIWYIYLMSGNKIYRNNFLNNGYQIYAMYDADDFFYQIPPIGGNYWSNYDKTTEGCFDQNNDNFCDSPHIFDENGQDNYPWIKQDSWKISANQSPIISNLNQYKSDGIATISESGITAEDAVIFKAIVNDSDDDQIKLQIELKEFSQSFNEQDLLEGGFVDSGSEATITRYGLIDGQYHWQVRAVDFQGNASSWQEFGTVGNVDFEVAPLGKAAAELAKLVINAPYLGDGTTWGGKGWDSKIGEYVSSDTIFSGYNFWNNNIQKRKVEFGAGLDCSGLTQWAFNRSYDPQKSLTRNVIRWDSADGQYKNNTETIIENDLQSGDLLFLDKGNDNFMDHVAMYTGNFVMNGETFDIVEAYSPREGIVPADKTKFKARIGFDINKHFRRVALSPSMGGQVKAGSPIDLIVTNPDGFTITSMTAIQTDEEYLREIPGELYYTESELGPDGRPEDIVYWPKQKTGDYIIKVLPENGIAPTETYSLEFTAGESTIILADDIPLNQIPSDGYGVNIADSGTINTFLPIVIDIKPDSYPNSINLGSKGTVPVAIFGSNAFDVHQINLESLALANASIKLKSNGKLMASYDDVNEDGFMDVVVHVIADALQLTPIDAKAELNGFLFDGRKIKGADFVRIVPQ